jgi:hypothetical protein
MTALYRVPVDGEKIALAVKASGKGRLLRRKCLVCAWRGPFSFPSESG